MHNYKPEGRYPLLDRPVNLPGLDIIHKSPDGPVFDLTIDTDNLLLGTAYLQAQDVEQMARSLGWISPEEFAAKDQRIKELEAQIKVLPEIVEEYKDGLVDLSDKFHDRLVSAASIPLASVGEEPESESEESGSDAETSGQVDSDNIDKGPNGISGSPSNEFGFLNLGKPENATS